ncbi:MAG TPA: hypothetical protein VJN01_01630, partial [Xanthomonadales bacterium]|nr:hypothetical protein [Xanthomonadales bacterium]
MKKMVFALAAVLAVNVAVAQEAETATEEDYTVVLPESAQACVLPAAPDSIPPDATYDQLVEAKKHVADFQAGLGVYRECMTAAETSAGEALTPGNKQALVQSYNYSVDMEERVATRFNDAIRSYKE